MRTRLALFLIILFPLGFVAQAQQNEEELEVRYNQYGVKVDRQKLQAEARDGILVFESKNENYKLWLDTRVQADAAAFWGVEDGYDPIGNGAKIRRARFAIKAQITPSWYGEIDTDFGSGKFELKDAIIGYTGLKNWTFRGGNFKEGFSMESTTSSRYLALMERPMVVSAFAPSRHLGIEAEYAKGAFRSTLGMFFQSIEDSEVAEYVDDNNKDFGRSQGYSYTYKVNYMPQSKDKTMGLHFGAAISYRTPKTDVSTSEFGTSRYSVRNGTSINRKKYIDTDLIRDVQHDLLYGFELAGYAKGFRFQSEFIGNKTKVKSFTNEDNLSDKHFKGWYAYAGYMLFGGKQNFNRGEGEFTMPSRGRSWGDIELLFRYDYLNLNSQNILGGSGENFTVGLNYWINKNVKVVLNYQYSNNDRYANGKGKLKVGYNAEGKPTSDYKEMTKDAGINYHMLALRMEINF